MGRFLLDTAPLTAAKSPKGAKKPQSNMVLCLLVGIPQLGFERILWGGIEEHPSGAKALLYMFGMWHG